MTYNWITSLENWIHGRTSSNNSSKNSVGHCDNHGVRTRRGDTCCRKGIDATARDKARLQHSKGGTSIILRLMEMLKKDEGFRPYPYDDITGMPIPMHGDILIKGYATTGYGWNMDALPISKEAAEFILGEHVNQTLKEMGDQWPWWRDLPELAQIGLANMTFNMGLSRTRGFKKMLLALQRGDFETAADEALDSTWATQVGARAERIAELYRACSAV